jgi:hypothetical protein
MMAGTIRKVAYFIADAPDRPGEAACALAALAQAKVNLLAFTGFPAGARRSQFDFVPRDPARFARAARKAGIKVRAKKEGFLVQGDDRAGAMARVLERLADAGINLTAIDAVAAGGGRFGAIFWVKPRDVARTARALRAR